MPTFESIAAFSKRVNLPERLVRSLVRQGQLPHVKTGKCHVRIHVEAGMEAIKQYSEQTAEEIAATMPVPMRIISTQRTKIPTERKYRGRPPDKVRLANKR